MSLRNPLLRSLPALTAVFGATAAILPAAAAAVTVAQPGGATSVRALGRTIVFSEYDATTSRWYLDVRNSPGPVVRLKVPSSPTPFDADVGTDSDGRPEVIYQRCAGTTVPLRGCDLYVFSLGAPTGERPVRNANDPDHSDVHPTLWRGRIAWTREYGTSTAPNPVVYTKLLSAPRSQPSTRLPAVPERRCGDVEPVCVSTTGRQVEALDLRGDDLALIVRYSCRVCTGISQTEVRLDSVTNRTARQIALLYTGLAGQHLVGPALYDGHLAWYKACAVSEPSCRTAVGPWRYLISTGRYQRGEPGPMDLDGFADTGSRLYEAGCHGEPTAPADVGAAPDCRIDAVAPPVYTTASAPLG